MKKRLNTGVALAAVGMMCLLGVPQAQASGAKQEMELLRQQVELLKQQNQQLSDRLAEMEKKVDQQAVTPAQYRGDRHENLIEQEVARQLDEKGIGRISDHLTLSGLFEGDYRVSKDFSGAHSSGFDLSTLELYLDAKVNEWVSGHVEIEYSDDEANDDNKMRIDEAYATLGNTGKFPLFLTLGKMYVPSGDFSSNMLQDPLTQTLGEINDTTLVLGFEHMGFTGKVFAYNGMDRQDPDNDTINAYGASLSYSWAQDDKAFNAGGAWVSNIADSIDLSDSDAFTVGGDGLVDEIPALSLFMNGKVGPWSAITEYVRALDSFAASEFAYGEGGAEPAALNIEAAYTTDLWNLETVFALGYQRAWETVNFLPEHRYIGTVSMRVFEGTVISLEYYYDKDYSESDGGTDNNGYGFTTRLAYEF